MATMSRGTRAGVERAVRRARAAGPRPRRERIRSSRRWGRVAVLAEMGEDLPPKWQRRAQTLVRVGATDLDETHHLLAAHGPFDLVIDVLGRGAARRFPVVTPHLDLGGLYVGCDPGDRLGDLARRLRRLGTSSDALNSPQRRMRKKQRDKIRLAGVLTISEAAPTRGGSQVVTARQGTRTVAVVREEAMDGVLNQSPRGRIIAQEPSSRWASKATFSASREHPVNSYPAEYRCPPLSVREYDDATMLSRQGAVAGNIVLPESFRNNLAKRLKNPVFDELTDRFMTAPPEPTEHLSGRWLHLDTHVPGHFGHAMTEQLSQTWGWHKALASGTPLDGAVLFSAPGTEVPRWTVDLLGAAGVPPAALRVCRQPTRVERLIASTPGYNIGTYAHPVMAEVWNRVGETLEDVTGTSESPIGPRWPEKIFLTRRSPKRNANNRSAIESAFKEHGFVVISPEDFSLATQATLVRRARVVAGLAGSQMFSIALADRPLHVVLITSESYPAHNEYLMCALRGHRLDLLVASADIPRSDRFTSAAFHSSYTVDLDGADGDFLRAALRSS